MCPRWYSIVFCVTKSCEAASRFVIPDATSSATVRSCGVNASIPHAGRGRPGQRPQEARYARRVRVRTESLVSLECDQEMHACVVVASDRMEERAVCVMEDRLLHRVVHVDTSLERQPELGVRIVIASLGSGEAPSCARDQEPDRRRPGYRDLQLGKRSGCFVRIVRARPALRPKGSSTPHRPGCAASPS